MRAGDQKLGSDRFLKITGSVANNLIILALTFLGLIAFTFFLGRVVPIDPILKVVGDRATAEQYEAARIAMGLDKPLWQQFIYYLTDIIQGDFGRSISTNQPVIEDLKIVFPATLEMATIGILMGLLIGVPMGVMAATFKGTWIDQVLRVFGLLGYSIPAFWLGLVGLVIFYVKLQWLPGPGRVDTLFLGVTPTITGVLLFDSLWTGEIDIFWSALGHIILPASILGFFSLAYIARMTRSFMLDQLNQEYITTARVKGLSEWRVIWVHAFGNIRVQLITVIGLSYASLLEGSVMVESVFAWNGIGNYLTKALFNVDMNAVLGSTLVIGTVFIIINRLSDILYRLLDPRSAT